MITNRRRDELTPEDYRLANIGENYWAAELTDIPEKWVGRQHLVTYCAKIVEHLKDGIGLMFVGPNGTGKTHLGVICQKEAIRHAARTLFVSVEGLSSARINRTSLDQVDNFVVIDKCRTVDLLVMDDLGNEHISEFDRRVVEGLVRERSNANRSTIFTTNLSLKELSAKYGASLRSVLTEKTLPLSVNFHNYRDAAAADLGKRFFGESA